MFLCGLRTDKAHSDPRKYDCQFIDGDTLFSQCRGSTGLLSCLLYWSWFRNPPVCRLVSQKCGCLPDVSISHRLHPWCFWSPKHSCPCMSECTATTTLPYHSLSYLIQSFRQFSASKTSQCCFAMQLFDVKLSTPCPSGWAGEFLRHSVWDDSIIWFVPRTARRSYFVACVHTCPMRILVDMIRHRRLFGFDRQNYAASFALSLYYTVHLVACEYSSAGPDWVFFHNLQLSKFLGYQSLNKVPWFEKDNS